MPVQLFLPKPIACYLEMKQEQKHNAALPLRVVSAGEKLIVRVQRKTEDSMSMLDYPFYVVDPSNLIYPTYLCSWIDCKRRLALVNYVQDGKQVNEHTVFGSTCHRLLEWLAESKITVN